MWNAICEFLKAFVGKVSVNKNSEDYQNVLGGSEKVSAGWEKLNTAVTKQLNDALQRIKSLEESAAEDRAKFIAQIRSLQQEFLDCEQHRTESQIRISQLEQQHADNKARIEALEDELRVLRGTGKETKNG